MKRRSSEPRLRPPVADEGLERRQRLARLPQRPVRVQHDDVVDAGILPGDGGKPTAEGGVSPSAADDADGGLRVEFERLNVGEAIGEARRLGGVGREDDALGLSLCSRGDAEQRD